MHLGFLGLLLLIPVGGLAEYLIVAKLSFRSLVLLMALIVGGGFAYLGWEVFRMSSSRQTFLRFLFVFACVVVALLGILIINQVLLHYSMDGTETVIYQVPGVYAESSVNTRRAIINNVPPYWVFVIIYGIISSAIGYLIHKVRNSFQMASLKKQELETIAGNPFA